MLKKHEQQRRLATAWNRIDFLYALDELYTAEEEALAMLPASEEFISALENYYAHLKAAFERHNFTGGH